MADEIKPVNSQGSNPQSVSNSSPLSPQVKIPTGNQPPAQSRPQVPPSGGSFSVPPNLPTDGLKSQMMPSPSQAQVRPTPPPPVSGSAQQNKPPMPQTFKPPVPTTPPPVSPNNAPVSKQSPSGLDSSIRTMQADIDSLKKGEAPAGLRVDKELPKPEIKKNPEVATPKITPPPPPLSHAELGKLEKSKPMQGFSIPSAPQGQPLKPSIPTPSTLSPTKQTINIPSLGGAQTGKVSSRKTLFIIIGIVVVAAGVISFALLRQSNNQVAVSPTPSYSPTPSSTPILFESLFSVTDSIAVEPGPNFVAQFTSALKTDQLMAAREPGLYKITGTTSSDVKNMSFSEFSNSMGIKVPADLSNLIDDNQFFVTAMYKVDNKIGLGLIVGLKNAGNTIPAGTVLRSWESSMAQSFKSLFGIDLNKISSTTFSDNTYNGASIRYVNFPDPNSTIDYSIFRAKNNQNYIVITSSREHIYGLIDKVK